MDKQTLEACAFLGFALGWRGGAMPLWQQEAGGSTKTRWIRRPTKKLASAILGLPGERHDLTVGLPCERPSYASLTGSTVLWAWVEGGEQLEHAKRFRPHPSFVLKVGTGSRRLLLWTLSEQLPAYIVEQANRKIAYTLRAPQKYGKLTALAIPVPGSPVLDGRRQAAAVQVTRMKLDDFSTEQVIGRLREPPPRDAWRKRRDEQRAAA